MKCDICGIRDAVLYVQQVSESSTIELHLCAECAREKGITSVDENSQKIEVSLGGILSGILQGQKVQEEQKRSCSGCGLSLPELKKRQLAGCPECYNIFRVEIIALLRNKGITSPYTGSLPKKLAYFQSKLVDRMTLQTRLQMAISSENYEMAALYRDRLRILDESGNFNGNNE